MFEAATNVIDITPVAPPFPSLWMGGYGWGPRANSGAVARPLLANCLVLWDNGVPNVLVRADLVGIDREIHQRIRDAVVVEGVASSDFLLAVSHTHSGPQMSNRRLDPYVLMGLRQVDVLAVEGTVDRIAAALVDLVRETLTLPRVPVTLHYSESCAMIGFNRVGESDVLTDVPILALRREDDSPYAVLFGAAAHPVARGNDAVFDSDYCGAAVDRVERLLDCRAMFFIGCCGDQEPVGGRSDEVVVDHGRTVADAVVNRMQDPASFVEVTGPIVTARTEVDLPLSVDLTDPAVRAALRAKYESRRDTLPPGEQNRRHAEVMLRMIDDGTVPTALPMPIQRWRFGGLTILGLAHEVLSWYDTRLRESFDGRLWVMGCVGEVESYVPHDRVLWAGGARHLGYEAGWAGDNTIAGFNTYTVPYAWPAPLKASPVGVEPAVPGSAEHELLRACLDLLGP
ncbi:hypothetical protein AB0I60_11425 [Actinosynnema sp. NPDC050436]|uniref:hypothetical protein n=1 Tax=Actinosynnema sp. NPDC050436 TaxID=3155659 RepID=UPI0033C435C5